MSAQQQINYGNTANDGQGDPLRTAFIKTDDNFDAIWNAGPVGSNVTVLNNTLQVVNANGNLVLAANGIGVIQTNTSLMPRFANLYDLGSANLRYRSAYIGSGGLSVTGNLTVGGTYSIANLVVNTISSDDSSFVTVQDGLSVRGDIDTVGIYTDGYFYANGAPFSPGGSSYGNADVANYLPVYGGQISSSVIDAGNINVNTVNTASIVNQFPVFITSNGISWEFAGNILRGPQGGTWSSAANTSFFNSPANGFLNLTSLQNGNVVSELFMEHSFIRFFIDNGIDATWEMKADGRTEFPGYTFPYADGNAGEVLKTDGAGNLAWDAGGVSTYGNANVVALGEAGWSGNIIPSANATYSLGNATNYWSNLWVANNTIYIGGVPLGMTAGNVLTVNGEPVLSNDSDTAITTTGNIAAGNILTDNYLYANGEPFVSASTGNITFTDTTMAPPDGVDITISAANSEVIIEAFDIRLDATDDLRLTGNDIVSLRNRSTTDPVTIITDYDNSETTWTFAVDGTLTAPGDITVAGDITGPAGASTLVLKAEFASNTSIQLNNSVDSVINTVANLEIRTDVSNTAKTWEFDNTGNLVVPGNVNFGGDPSAAPSLNDFFSVTSAVDFDIVANSAGTSRTFTFDAGGNLSVPGNVITVDSGNAIFTTTNGFGEVTGANGAALYHTLDGGANAQTIIVGNDFAAMLVDKNGQRTAMEVQPGNITFSGGNGNTTEVIVQGNISASGNISGNVSGFAIGYRDIPQVAFTGNATIAAADAGKHFYSTESTDYILTIADNSAVSWPVGTAITVVNRGTGNITVAQASGVSLYLAGNSSAGNRSVSTYGMATVLNVAANVWMINGTGVS